MVRITVVVREIGRLKPDYSLDFDLPKVPKVGDYISIQRPDKDEPFGEDMIVRQIWWRLKHPETRTHTTGDVKVGSLTEIYVECEPALGPWSSKDWRASLNAAGPNNSPELKVARVVFEER